MEQNSAIDRFNFQVGSGACASFAVPNRLSSSQRSQARYSERVQFSNELGKLGSYIVFVGGNYQSPHTDPAQAELVEASRTKNDELVGLSLYPHTTQTHGVSLP